MCNHMLMRYAQIYKDAEALVLVWDATTEHHRLGGFSATEIYFSPFGKQTGLRSGCHRGQAPMRALLQAVDGCALVLSSHGREGERAV